MTQYVAILDPVMMTQYDAILAPVMVTHYDAILDLFLMLVQMCHKSIMMSHQ